MKFYEALKGAIVPNVSRVIDVGAGTMLLSMMAYDLGSANVLGVEENRHMASIARDVLRVNNYTTNTKKGKIRLFEGSFESLYVGHKQVGVYFVLASYCFYAMFLVLKIFCLIFCF
jgi:predicted RNA methylase